MIISRNIMLLASCLATVVQCSGLEHTSGYYLQQAMKKVRDHDLQRSSVQTEMEPKSNFRSYRETQKPNRADSFDIDLGSYNENAVSDGAYHHTDGLPSLDLTKGELTALYEAALHKGSTVNVPSPSIGTSLHAVYHELEPNGHEPSHDGTLKYHYYYYPIKSFLDDHQIQQGHHDIHETPHSFSDHPHPSAAVHNHEHHHNHKLNLHIAMKDKEKDDNDHKGVQPLFMAISGFVGMAIMFAATVLFMPKLGNKARSVSDELASLTRLVVEAAEGQDCSERLSCELGKMLRVVQLNDKPISALEGLLPTYLNKQLTNVRRYALKNEKCSFIPCRKNLNFVSSSTRY